MEATAAPAAPRLACLDASGDGRWRAGGVHGEVWSLERVGGVGGGVGVGGGWRRRLLGDFEVRGVPLHVVVLSAHGHTFAFAGVLRMTQRALKVWMLDAPGGPRELELALPKDGKLRGFGAVAACAAERPGQWGFRVACGLGIGKAHVWQLEVCPSTLRCQNVLLGSVSPRQNSISALAFAQDAGRLVTMTATPMQRVSQVWDVAALLREHRAAGGAGADAKPFSASSRFGSTDAGELEMHFDQTQIAALAALHEGFHTRQPRALAARLAAPGTHSGDRLLFPLAEPDSEEMADSDDALDPAAEVQLAADAYEGDLDADGRPHGVGSCSVGDGLTYRGQWARGERHGQGVLTDEATGQAVYEGGWAKGARHGQGTERTASDEYTGAFKRGKRHGFGLLQIRARTAIPVECAHDARGKPGKAKRRQRHPGESYAGFWSEGSLHGLGRWAYPVRSPAFAAPGGDDLVHLGKIGCTTVHARGKLRCEVGLFRLDGVAIAGEDQRLLGAAFGSEVCDFSADPCGRWPGVAACWGCMKSEPDLVCPQCSLMVHNGCQSGAPGRCPMPACGQAAMEEWNVALKGGSATLDPKQTLKARLRSVPLPAAAEGPEPGTRAGSTSRAERTKRARPAERQPAPAGASQAAEDGIAAARLLGKRTRQHRAKLTARFFDDLLAARRRQEIGRRKGWNAESEALKSELVRVEADLSAEQATLSERQATLSRFQGQGLGALSVDELTRLQDRIELALNAAAGLAVERASRVSAA